MGRLLREQALLVVIDVQERLVPVILDHEEVVANVVRLIRGCHTLSVPAIATEQYVKGLGPSVGPIRSALAETSGHPPIEKVSFSSMGCLPFEQRVRDSGRRQILLAGIEAHVCLYQTASDLLAAGYEVHVATDAVSSRTAANRQVGLARVQAEGGILSSTEMALFEMARVSGTDEFRAISRLVR